MNIIEVLPGICAGLIMFAAFVVFIVQLIKLDKYIEEYNKNMRNYGR